jgi:uncharacterized protein
LRPPKKRLANKPTLLIGVSTRALADSAVAGNHRVVALDFFGDRDKSGRAPGYSLKRDWGLDFSPANLLIASREIDYQSVVYTSNLENYPEVVAAFERNGDVLGNSPESLKEVRRWRILRRFCSENSILTPKTLLPGEEIQAGEDKNWLVKSERSGGGHGIRPWQGEALPEGHILQEAVAGKPASVLFVADGKKGRILGVTEQLIGRSHFCDADYRWCGNMIPMDVPDDGCLWRHLETMVSSFAKRFGLRGVNGIDMMVDRTTAEKPRCFFLEVNPRYTAAMELLEQACNINIFSLHIAGAGGVLPTVSPALLRHKSYSAKGIVFARRNLTIPQTDDWIDRQRRDIPFPGDRVAAGAPICSVFAWGDSRKSCLRRLQRAADAVRMDVGDELEGREPC